MSSPTCRRRAKPYSDDELRNLRNTTSRTNVHNDLDQPDSGNPRPNARRVREHPYPRSARPHGAVGIGMLMPVDIEFSLPELRDGITAAKRARSTRRRHR